MTYVADWTPEDALLFERPETATGIFYSISCTLTPPAVEPEEGAEEPPPPPPVPSVLSYSAELTPETNIIKLKIKPAAVEVSASSLAGIFKAENIGYVESRFDKKSVTNWKDLPAHGIEIYEFKPSRTTQQTHNLTVRAHLSNRLTEEKTYQLIVTQEWTAGQSALKEALNASSN